jgi:hypothetical protein
MEFADYKSLVFALVKPPAKITQARRLKNKAEYAALLNEATTKNLLVYYAEALVKDGREYAKQPWRLDSDSMPNVNVVEQPQEQTEPVGLKCPFCGKKMSSTSGITLHVKSKHPDKLDEHLQIS